MIFIRERTVVDLETMWYNENIDEIYEAMDKIKQRLEEEKQKPTNEADSSEINKLLYAQLMQGMKLSTTPNNPLTFYI